MEDYQDLDTPPFKLSKKYNPKITNIPKLPIKWTRELSESLKKRFKGKSFQEMDFTNLGNEALEIELIRFREVLLWYDENIKEKFMPIEEIFWECISQGPAFADYLADTLKYSIRKTLGIRVEDSLRDYPILEGSIDYIFDPKCLVEWEATDPEDYLYLFREEKVINEELVERVLHYFPDLTLVKPDILDYLKLFRKSKIFNSDKLRTETCFKDVIHNPRWKTPQRLF
jgi:hypothetical protein